MINKSRLFADISIIKICIAVFLVIYVGMYYAEYLAYIKVAYLFLAFGIVLSIIKHKKILHQNIFGMVLVFILFSFISSLWAKDISDLMTALSSLIKATAIAFLFSQMVSSKEDFKWTMFWLFASSIIFSIIYLTKVPLADLDGGRITDHVDDDTLPNVNVVAMLVSFSFVYFLYIYFIENKVYNAILAIISAIITILLGSRKSILVILLSIIILILKLEFKSKVKLAIFASLILLISIAVIPSEYLEFIFERFIQLDISSSSKQMLDYSDQIRVRLFENGISFIAQSPLLGHGFYNFSELNGQLTGIYYYSHNNFIETFVGGGLCAFLLYYSLYVKIFRNVGKRLQLNYGFIIFVLLIILLFNHITIVVLLDKFVWLLLVLLSIGSSYYKRGLI